MDRFDAMQAFAQVVETGSFTQAARALNLSRASVTQLIQQLEARLRVRLLHRTTRKVNVTADGAAYYERVLRLLDDMDDAETSLSAATSLPRGRLRVDMPSPLARLILVPALPHFQAQYPDIQLHLGVSDRPVDLIDERVDCVLRAGELSDLSLAARRLAQFELGAFAAPAYLARAGQPEHPRALLQPAHAVVAYASARTGKPLVHEMRRGEELHLLQGRQALVVDEGNAYLAAGVAGLGVLCMPVYMARPHLSDGSLVPLFQDWGFDSMPLYLAYRPHRHVSAKLRVFIDWVAALMAQVSVRPPQR